MKTLDIMDFGARVGAVSIDAIRAAVAAATPGDTVLIPEGRFLSFSVALKSHLHIHLAAGAVLEAADPAIHGGRYDEAEPNPWDLYQDFGHSHWKNSLLWGIEVEDIRIDGPGMIHGRGLTREGPGSRWRKQAGEFPESMRGMSAEELAHLSPEVSAMAGLGNKTLAFCKARDVVLRDFTLLDGGHFALLATGVDGLTIENLLIDTNRDGLDIDGCRRVTVRGCRVNTPNDDAIVLKAGYSLGRRVPTEDVVIEHCAVSGFDPGTLYNGTKERTQLYSPDRDRVTGRIKIGTESSGDFRRIRIADCTFDRSRGLALETVDGGIIEDVVCENLRLDDITTAPIFLRVGARLRGPDGIRPGAMRQVVIRNVEATNVLGDYAALVVGMADHPIEDVTLENIRLGYAGGGTAEDAARNVPELDDAYPEPSMFGRTPAWGLWTRHVRDLSVTGFAATTTGDARPERRFDDTTFSAGSEIR